MRHIAPASIVIVILSLSACTTTPRKPAVTAVSQAQAFAAQSAREDLLNQQSRWGFIGRVAVTTATDNGNASVSWQVDGEKLEIRLSAPVTRKTWRLIGDGDRYQIEGIDQQPRSGDDPEVLVREATGWPIPIRAMSHWVRGLRAPNQTAQLSFDPAGFPALLQQHDWQVQFREWFDEQPQRPRRVFAENAAASAKVRLVVEQWN